MEIDNIYVGSESHDLTVLVYSTKTILPDTDESEHIFKPTIPFDGSYLRGITLKELKRQVSQIYGDKVIITVIDEMGLSGSIYKYSDGVWKKHGETKGYA